MLSLNKKLGLIILGVILMLGVASLAYAFSFAPDIIAFDNADCAGHPNCVGVTMPANDGYNGWDVDQVGLYYDSANDVLHVGISMWNDVIAGDVENDGDPGGAHSCLGGWPVDDYANLGGPSGGTGEAIDFIFDATGDDTYDYIAGVSRYTDISGFAVAQYGGSTPPAGCYPGQDYGATAGTGSVTNNPNSGNPDFEFTINNFCTLMGKQPACNGILDFNFAVRTGSTKDAGTGEDCLEFDWNPTAVTLSSFAAESSSDGWASPLWLGGMAGLTVLAVGSLLWAKRRAG